ncbi:YihA family ribosome biogenesis GTP-binding protein [Fervidobacterium thailandense]|uniref:Probable GTP-binding protein EngB n=1 Tax=Fervidobacterium thailandense TaxID=1008305 RepID=A0A1E3G3U7_9BACT|nr:YihA family ribosome biogenesis GTP-binding protein [Fervidobacterium thailandense]
MKVEDVRLEKVIARPGDRFPEPKAGEFPFVGRSNVGKSSLLNALLGKKVAFVSKNPGKTRSINYYLINHKFYFVDLPGYGYAKVSKKEREEWRKIIERYFHERDWNIKTVFSLIDSRHELMDSDTQLLGWLQSLGIQPTVVLTKVDKLSSTERNRQLSYFERVLPEFGVEHWIPCSSVTGENLEKIWTVIVEKLEVLR